MLRVNCKSLLRVRDKCEGCTLSKLETEVRVREDGGRFAVVQEGVRVY